MSISGEDASVKAACFGKGKSESYDKKEME